MSTRTRTASHGSPAARRPGPARSPAHAPTRRIALRSSPLNLIDLLAILPFYVEAVTGGSSEAVGLLRMLRVLRVVRVFRVFKAAKGMESVGILATTMRSSTAALNILFFFLGLSVLLFSSLMYTSRPPLLPPRPFRAGPPRPARPPPPADVAAA